MCATGHRYILYRKIPLGQQCRRPLSLRPDSESPSHGSRAFDVINHSCDLRISDPIFSAWDQGVSRGSSPEDCQLLIRLTPRSNGALFMLLTTATCTRLKAWPAARFEGRLINDRSVEWAWASGHAGIRILSSRVFLGAAYHYCSKLFSRLRGLVISPTCRSGLSWWQQGQRGSQLVKTRAISRRAVMNESSKCRSGRDAERMRRTFPSFRGGKMLHAFGNNEGEAAERDRHMVVPPEE